LKSISGGLPGGDPNGAGRLAVMPVARECRVGNKNEFARRFFEGKPPGKN
jgi:hypothetical protein